MTPELESKLNQLISKEHAMAMIEADHMSIMQTAGYPGFKRQHRYLQRWRNESALCLRCFLGDHFGIVPKITVSYATPAMPPKTYTEAVRAIIAEYESLRMDYVKIVDLALNEDLDHLMQILECKIGWVSKTIMKYYRDLKEVENSGENAVYLQQRSEMTHEKYKRKEKEFSIDIDM